MGLHAQAAAGFACAHGNHVTLTHVGQSRVQSATGYELHVLHQHSVTCLPFKQADQTRVAGHSGAGGRHKEITAQGSNGHLLVGLGHHAFIEKRRDLDRLLALPGIIAHVLQDNALTTTVHHWVQERV